MPIAWGEKGKVKNSTKETIPTQGVRKLQPEPLEGCDHSQAFLKSQGEWSFDSRTDSAEGDDMCG
jgi:hypothetical protein